MLLFFVIFTPHAQLSVIGLVSMHMHTVGTVEVKKGSHSVVLIMLQCRFCIGKKTLNNFLQIQRLILCTVVLTILLYCNVDATNVCVRVYQFARRSYI